MSNIEEIEKQILDAYYKTKIDEKHDTKPTSVKLDYTHHEDPATRQGYWYVEDEILVIASTDTSLESCVKTLATKFAWLSVSKMKHELVLLVMLIISLSPIFTWNTGLPMILLFSISFVTLISFPIVWRWGYNVSKLEEAEIKFLMTETKVISGEEEIEEYYNSLAHTGMGDRFRIIALIAAELFNLLFSIAFWTGI